MTDHQKIKQALALAGDKRKIASYYDQWAQSYDADVESEHYAAPAMIAGLALELYKDGRFQREMNTLRVLDAGCGTGLGGKALHQVGFRDLVGFDLSTDMIRRAEEPGIYSALLGNVDLNQCLEPQLERDHFDLTICIGVFTLGHVQPSVLTQLTDITATGGFVLTSAREEYCNEYPFQAALDDLEKAGKASIIYNEFLDYVSGDRALYSALQIH